MEDNERNQERQRKKALKIAELQRKEDLNALLAIPEFRRFIWDVLGDCHVFGMSYSKGADTYFNEGERNIGLKIIARLIEADPTSFAKMQIEHHVETIKGDSNA